MNSQITVCPRPNCPNPGHGLSMEELNECLSNKTELLELDTCSLFLVHGFNFVQPKLHFRSYLTEKDADLLVDHILHTYLPQSEFGYMFPMYPGVYTSFCVVGEEGEYSLTRDSYGTRGHSKEWVLRFNRRKKKSGIRNNELKDVLVSLSELVNTEKPFLPLTEKELEKQLDEWGKYAYFRRRSEQMEAERLKKAFKAAEKEERRLSHLSEEVTKKRGSEKHKEDWDFSQLPIEEQIWKAKFGSCEDSCIPPVQYKAPARKLRGYIKKSVFHARSWGLPVA